MKFLYDLVTVIAGNCPVSKDESFAFYIQYYLLTGWFPPDSPVIRLYEYTAVLSESHWH